MRRWFAPISTRTYQPIRMFRGGPGRRSSTDLKKQEMGFLRVVVLFDYEDGPMLYRYASSGEFAGDTWHQSLDQAKDQAEFEYESALGPWHEIPEDVAEGKEVDFALREAATR